MSVPATETHPFKPFLPANAKVLMLGSFPPQPKRWSMVFYYPNWINDFWRICGIIFFGDKEHFTIPEERRFNLDLIVPFCEEKGIAMYDTATEIRRLQDNASDKFLEVVTPTDIPALLEKIPECHAIVTTGQKATDTLCETFHVSQPDVLRGDSAGNTYSETRIGSREMRLYRLPSTSRAYPLSLERKADAYRRLFSELGML